MTGTHLLVWSRSLGTNALLFSVDQSLVSGKGCHGSVVVVPGRWTSHSLKSSCTHPLHQPSWPYTLKKLHHFAPLSTLPVVCTTHQDTTHNDALVIKLHRCTQSSCTCNQVQRSQGGPRSRERVALAVAILCSTRQHDAWHTPWLHPCTQWQQGTPPLDRRHPSGPGRNNAMLRNTM